MAEVWLITGIPGAGKTTAAQLLAQRFDRAAVIEGDGLHGMIASGIVWPGMTPADEAEQQMDLCVRNQCLLARSFADAGFTPVIDYVVVNRKRLDAYKNLLAGIELHFVVLNSGQAAAAERDLEREKSGPFAEQHGRTIAEHFSYLEEPLIRELKGTGLWIGNSRLTPEATVDAILADAKASLLIAGK